MGQAYLFRAHESWNAIFWFSYVMVFAVVMWVARRERHYARGEVRDRGSKAAIYAGTFAGIALAFVGPYLFPAARIRLPAAGLFWTAIGEMWLGTFFYVWAVLTLGSFFRTSVQLVEGQRLVVRGPYRLLRHPAYTGGVLIFSGVGLATGNGFSFAASTLCLIAGYLVRIRVEEAALAERFGAEFEARKKKTWAMIPLVW